MRDLNRDLNGTSWPSYYYGVLPRPDPDLFPGVDKDILKQKMLEHETLFKNQVFELHRVYRVQRDMMGENKKDEFTHRTIYETSSSSIGDFFRKGKNVQRDCASPRNSEASQSRPVKVRKMIDLQLPADQYLDMDEKTKYQEIASKPSTCFRKPNALADLNEPPEIEETTGIDNSPYIDRGNSQNWFSSMLKAGGTNQAINFKTEPLHLRPVQSVLENPHQPPGLFPQRQVKEDPWPSKANDGFNMFERSRCLSSYGNSQPPSYVTPSNLSDLLARGSTQKPVSAQTTPFAESLAKSNGFVGAWWQRNADPRCNPGYGTETPVQNGFYHGSSSRAHKEVPSYLNGGSSDKAPGKVRSSFDLNEALPNGLFDESLAPQVEAKHEDRVSVIPWLRANASIKESGSSRNVLDNQESVASTSCNADDRTGRKKLLLDINVACEDPEEFENVEIINKKTEIERPNAVRVMIDLNACVTEDEIPSIVTENGTKRPERFVIDLEAPVNPEDDDEAITEHVVDGDFAKRLAREAADSIVALSSSVLDSNVIPGNHVETHYSEDDTLGWFVDLVCSFQDDVKTGTDDFEEMTLKLSESTVEEYFLNPPVFDFLEDTGPGFGAVSVTGRARRGPARRGRQKKDFQRDVLPGLGSLARHEVTEDLQTFGGLMKATGHTWQCRARANGSRRGRRRKVACKPSNGDITVLEDGSLTSWGKTTRRPRRQRCPVTAPPVGLM